MPTLLPIVFSLAVALWTPQAVAPAGTGSTPLPIVVSLPPQVWLVESIGGERVSVAALVGPGDSEETFSPTDAQVSAALRARILFRIGASFEEAPWFHALDAGGRAHGRGLEIVDTRAGVDLLPTGDPHIWLSPRRLTAQARIVAESLGRIDPPGRDLYQRGLESVTRDLERLDRELASTLEPYRGRVFFVFHPSWGYFANDYGLRQVAIENEGSPPTDYELTRLQEKARTARIRTLFVQPQITGRGAEAVAAAVGANVVRLDPLARDLPANLRSVARRLVESFER